MKWRDLQLIIILVLLGYIALNLAFLFPSWRQPADGSPPPAPTARPGVASPAIRVVAPTSTVRPRSTPVPPAPSEPVDTAAPTDTTTPTSQVELEPTSTPTPTEEPQPSVTPTPEVQIHVVQQGENLFRIAERYGVTMQAIVEQNHLADPDRIYVGQTLVIPFPPPPTPSG